MTALLLLTACSTPRGASTLLLGGDVMLSRAGVPLFKQENPWENVTSFLEDNPQAVFAVNLESPFGTNSSINDLENSDMNLCAEESEVSILTAAGIDLVTTANNHMNDCPVSSTLDTNRVVENAGMSVLGANQVAYLPVGTQKAAFIAVDAYSGEYDLSGIFRDIESSRQKSDLVVVSIHWGNEYQAGPSRDQEDLAQELVNAGADLVWGHHPHVLQRMEWLESSTDGHAALVMYSLGNLLADQWMLPDSTRSVLTRIDFKDHMILGIQVLPLKMDAQSRQLQLVTQKQGRSEITDRLDLNDLTENSVNVEVWEK